MKPFTPVPKPVKQDKPKPKGIKPRSKKRAIQEREYAKKRKEYLSNHLYCEMRLEGCLIVANQIHHIESREGNLLTDTSNFMACCHPCHAWVTEHSKEAIELGLSVSRLAK